MQFPRTQKTHTGKALEDTFAQLIFNEGEGAEILQPYAKRILLSRLHVLKLLPMDREDLDFYKLKESMDVMAILEGLVYQNDFEKVLYDNTYSRFKDSEITWEQMLASEITSDEEYKNEIFVRLVEEKHGVEITSWKQLQELTGLREFYLSYDSETGAFTKQDLTKKEAQNLANKELTDVFSMAMSYRYLRLLESILVSGGKYKDLLEVSPTEFFLPESVKTNTIAVVISLFFGIQNGTDGRLSLRDIANQIEAPYEIVLSAQDAEF